MAIPAIPNQTTVVAQPKAGGTVSVAELIAQAKAQGKVVTGRSTGKLTLKVSVKGALSCYGLGRFPVTLYASQWRALLAFAPNVAAFLDEHKDTLTEKDSAE